MLEEKLRRVVEACEDLLSSMPNAKIEEGARRVIANGYHITTPEVVENALGKYRDNNDWLAHFLEDCCEIDPSYIEKSGKFYRTYRAYCASAREWAKSTTDFYAAIASAGFTRHRLSRGSFIYGVRLKGIWAECETIRSLLH